MNIKVNPEFIAKNFHYEKLCQKNHYLEGVILSDQLDNVPECIDAVKVSVQFYVHQSMPAIELKFDYNLNLECRVCLEEYIQKNNCNFKGIFTKDTSRETFNNITKLGYETISFTDNSTLLAIIEEEMILQIPLLPNCNKHEKESIESSQTPKIALNKPFSHIKQLQESRK